MEEIWGFSSLLTTVDFTNLYKFRQCCSRLHGFYQWKKDGVGFILKTFMSQNIPSCHFVVKFFFTIQLNTNTISRFTVTLT